MNIYIFLTFPIQNVGGGQCYVAAKAKYLESQGWKVILMSGGFPNDRRDCPINYLNKFIDSKVPELGKQVYELSRFIVNKGIKRMLKLVGDFSQQDKIIIESHTDTAALWGEILAHRLGARHFYIAMYEQYRGGGKNFEKKMDFYLFKMERKEILCNYRTANRLFEGVRQYKEEDIERIYIDEAPVQDVTNTKVDAIQRYDYNICYIGRTHKNYVPHIIDGVGEFASKYPNKKIQLLIVGDADKQRDVIEEVKNCNRNLIITEIGNLHPLPRNLYSKIDVVVAGSGSARCSVEEKALTIVADTESDKALGILGYDTNDSVFRNSDSVVTSYSDSLERVLIQQVYKKMTFKYPPKMGVAECTEQNFSLMSKASKDKRYYDERKIRKGKFNLKSNLNYLRSYLKMI